LSGAPSRKRRRKLARNPTAADLPGNGASPRMVAIVDALSANASPALSARANRSASAPPRRVDQLAHRLPIVAAGVRVSAAGTRSCAATCLTSTPARHGPAAASSETRSRRGARRGSGSRASRFSPRMVSKPAPRSGVQGRSASRPRASSSAPRNRARTARNAYSGTDSTSPPSPSTSTRLPMASSAM
jgi:hypothetical protein